MSVTEYDNEILKLEWTANSCSLSPPPFSLQTPTVSCGIENQASDSPFSVCTLRVCIFDWRFHHHHSGCDKRDSFFLAELYSAQRVVFCPILRLCDFFLLSLVSGMVSS